MLNRNVKRKAYGQAALTALCAAGLFSVLYLIRGFYPFGEGSIVITDLYSQYVPLLYRFYDVVTGQKNLFIDFSVSAGANLYADTINEVINPFNYVLLLFGRDRIYQAVNVVLLLYVTAAAASADFFLLKAFPKSRRWNVILSLCYAFSGYMAYNYQIIKWMYFPVLFPLFCLALYRLLRGGKGGIYAVLLGYQLMLSIQLGFMTLLFTLFGSGIYFFFCVKKEERPEIMCRLGLHTVAGLLLSSAVLVPNAAILLSSSRAGENLSYFGVMKRHGLDDLFERLFQIAHPVLLALFVWCLFGKRTGRRRAGGGRKAGLSGTGEAGLSALVPQWKVRVRQLSAAGKFLACLNLLLWLTVLLQPANLLWHMGSYVCFPVRYAYMVLLAEVCLVKRMLTGHPLEGEIVPGSEGAPEGENVPGSGRTPEGENVPGSGRTPGGENVPGSGRTPEGEIEPGPEGARKGEKANTARRTLLAASGCVLLCLGGCALFLSWEDRIVQAFSSLAISLVCPKETLVVCLVLAMFFAAALCALTGAACRKLTICVTAVCGLCLNLFFFLPPDYGVRLSNEAAYRKMVRQEEESAPLMRVKDDPELPLNAALVNGQSSLSGYFPTASRSYRDALESLGYLVPWVATQSVGGTAVSDALLSAGILFEESGEALALNDSLVLARQARIAVLMTGEDCFRRIGGGKLRTDETGAIRLGVEGERTLYLDPGMTADCFDVWINGEPLEIPEAMAAYSEHRIVELGDFSDEEITILVTDKNGMPLPVESMEVGMLDRQSWERAASGQNVSRVLTGEELTIDEAGGQIQITLENVSGGRTVFLPIAALDGWRCAIDGEAADIVRVFDGFLGIAVGQGSRKIVLTFVPRGLRVGMLLTVLGVLGLSGGAFFGRRAYVKRILRPVCFLYRLLLIGTAAAVYLVPAAGLAVYLAAKVVGI